MDAKTNPVAFLEYLNDELGASCSYIMHVSVSLCVSLTVPLSCLCSLCCSGSARDEEGGLHLSAGNIPELDAVLAAHTAPLTDPSLLQALQAAVTLLPPRDEASERYPNMAPSYLRTALKVQQEGEGFVTAEMKRYAAAVALAVPEEGCDLDERDDLLLAYNVRRVSERDRECIVMYCSPLGLSFFLSFSLSLSLSLCVCVCVMGPVVCAAGDESLQRQGGCHCCYHCCWC